MPPKKRTRVDHTPKAAPEAIAEWVRNNDPLLGTTKVTINELFEATTIKSFDRQVYDTTKRQTVNTGESFPTDWAALKAELEARNASSPQWFIQLRKEDLTLEPDGCIGQRVECFVIVESPNPTLCPAYYVTATPLAHSDPEDHVPESFHHLSTQEVKWNPVVKANGDSINAFFMQRTTPKISFGGSAPAAAASTPSAPVTPAGFGFGSPAASTGFVAPMSFGTPAAAPMSFGTPAAAPISFGTPAAAPISFGTPAAAPISFGSSASTPATAPISFGTPAAPAAVAPSFGSPAAPPAPPASPSFGFGVSPAASSSAPAKKVTDTPKRIPVEDILFCVWSSSRMKALQKEIKEGSRIVITGAKLPGIDKPCKVQMQDDMKEKPLKAAHEFVLNKVFARENDRIKDFDNWMGEVPEFEPSLINYLQNTRAKILKTEAKESDEFVKMEKEVVPAVVALLKNAIADREPHRNSQKEIVDGATRLMKEEKLISKENCNIVKFYPSNKDIPFRCFGKVSGISEEGDVIRCVPEAYRSKNPFLTK